MEFGVIGISYKSASLELREQSCFTDRSCISFYEDALSIRVSQVVILSTCNRSEVYFLYEHPQELEQMKQLYIRYTQKENIHHMFVLHGREALQYLFEVCGGYQSALVGEDQIAHQMKRAYELSGASGACKKEMHKIWQTCFASIRTLKQQWTKHRYSVSLPYLMMQKLNDEQMLQDKTMIIIGRGEIAQLITSYAISSPLKKIVLCNRTTHSIEPHKKCTYVDFDKRYETIQQCDIICSATASPHIIIEKAQLQVPLHKQLFIDFALPRDIDDALRNEAMYTLWNLDDFSECIDEHKEQRIQDMRSGHTQLVDDVALLYEWLLHHHADQAIGTLTNYASERAQQTYDLLIQKLTLTTHEEHVLHKILHASFHRMIKEPMLQLKQCKEEDQKAYMTMLETLFQGDEVDEMEIRN